MVLMLQTRWEISNVVYSRICRPNPDVGNVALHDTN